MRRVIVVLVITVIGLFFVLSFKTTPVRPIAALSSPAPTNIPEVSGPPVLTPTPLRTVSGPVITMRWGPVQVAVTLRDKRIADVRALALPSDHQRSLYISEQVAPILHAEVLQAQSANIQTVSGATYTTVAYVQSLQAALDQAGV